MIETYLIKNNDLEVEILNFAATVYQIRCKDKFGVMSNVVLSYKDKASYIFDNANYLGVVVGRTAGRLSGGKFSLNNRLYQLECNDRGIHHHHGGSHGISTQFFKLVQHTKDSVELSLESSAFETGYPGNVKVNIVYKLSNNSLIVDMKATTDAPTLFDMAQHSYFNLSSDPVATVEEQVLQLNASRYLQLDDDGMVIAKTANISGSVFDFSEPTILKSVFESDAKCVKTGRGGIDHPFIIDQEQALRFHDPKSGRVMEVSTNQESVVIYSANQLANTPELLDARIGTQYMGICFEAQHIPNIINMDLAFKKPIIDEDNPYHNETVYTFSIEG